MIRRPAPPRPRSRHSPWAALALVSVALLGTGCGRPASRQLAEAIARGEVVLPKTAAGSRTAPAGGATSGSAVEPEAPRPPGRPPRDDVERAARVRRAIGEKRPVSDLVPASAGSRYGFAIESASGGAGPRLLLFDLAGDPALLVGEHEFATGDPVATEGASPRIERGIETAADTAEPLLLAEIHAGDRTVACGWWLPSRGTRFVCAPSIGGRSGWTTVAGELFETWEAELPGDGGVDRAKGTCGRALHLVGGRWREEQAFRCLGLDIDDALRQAGGTPLSSWQERSVQQRVAAARRAVEALDGGTAVGLLKDALAIDGCATSTWRLLGRAEFENGSAGRAAPSLAVALALSPRDLPAELDLADVLAVLDARHEPGAASLRRTLETLDRNPATAELVRRAGSRGRRPGPRELAAVLYADYLARTPPRDPRSEVARRHAAERLAALRGRRPAEPGTSAIPTDAPARVAGPAQVSEPNPTGVPAQPASSPVSEPTRTPGPSASP